jgi:hypothetical protein
MGLGRNLIRAGEVIAARELVALTLLFAHC